MTKGDFIPPIVIKFLSRFNSYGWSGNYSSWKEALKHSEGYDASVIIEKVTAASLLVKEGKAAYERDSVLFDEIEYSWPLVAALLWTALQEEYRLNILDFGGSLGSTYYQNRKFYKGLKSVRWNVVEQEQFASVGAKHFESNELKFYSGMEECIRNESPSTVLFSCVLQYLENPYERLGMVFKYRPRFIIVDSMPFQREGKDRITIQKVHPAIYKASYPCWLLERKKFIDFFSPHYSLVSEFKSHLFIRVDGEIIPYEGFLFERA